MLYSAAEPDKIFKGGTFNFSIILKICYLISFTNSNSNYYILEQTDLAKHPTLQILFKNQPATTTDLDIQILEKHDHAETTARTEIDWSWDDFMERFSNLSGTQMTKHTSITNMWGPQRETCGGTCPQAPVWHRPCMYI